MNYSNGIFRELSSFSSNIQTESTSRISLSEIKNLKLLKYKAKNFKKYRNNIKMPKIYLKTDNNNNSTNITEKNFLHSFSRKKHIPRNDNNLTVDKVFTNNTESKIDDKIYIKIKKPFYKLNPQRRKDSILDFRDQTRNLRRLKIDSYIRKKALNDLKESLIYNEAKTVYFDFNKSEEKRLINIFSDNLHSYLSYLKRKSTEESIINEKLIYKRNALTNKIMSMENKINKLLNKFENNLESKSFLLCVKECSINFNNFSKESQIDILYDLFKLYNYKHHSYKMNNFGNAQLFKDWLYQNNKKIKGNDNIKKTMYFNYILSSININNLFKIFNLIDNDYIKYHKVKMIYESLEDFDRTLQNDYLHIKLSLNNLTISNDKLIELKNELSSEERRKYIILKEFNLIKDKYFLFLDKYNIAKTNYLDNISDNKIYNNNKSITNNYYKINDKLNKIIKEIMKYDSKEIKQIKLEKNKKKVTTVIDKIKYIEKIMNYLLQYKEIQKYKNNIFYEIVMKEAKREQIMRKFRIKEETIKKLRELKIKKILEKKDKILFLPHKK